MKRRSVILSLLSLSLLSTVTMAEELTTAYSGQTLNILLGSGGAWEGYRTLGEEFTEQTGIKLQYTQLGSELYTRLILDLTTGTGAYDAFAYAYQWKHEIAPYTADLKSAATVPGAPDLALEDFPPRLVEIYGEVDDKLVGLPLLGDVTLLVYNKDQYSAVGLDPAVPPASWDAVYDNGVKLHTDGQAGFGLPGAKDGTTSILWMILFAANGGTFFDEDFKPLLNSEAGKAAARYMVEKLKPIAPPGYLSWSFPEMLQGMGSGQTSQAYMWPGGFGTLLDPAQSTAAAAIGWGPTPGASVLGGWALGVNDSSEHKEAALLWAAWLASPEVQLETAKLGSAPARTSVLSNAELVAANPQWPAVLAGMSGTVIEFPPIKESEQLLIILFDELNAALAGEKSADEAMDTAQAKAEKLMESAGYWKP